MRGLTIILAGSDAERFRSALTLLATQAAMGARARLFADGAAVALFQPPMRADTDHRYAAAGLPRLAELLDTALDLGGVVILCQSGLALTGIDPRALDPRFEPGGMAGIIATLGDDRLLAF